MNPVHRLRFAVLVVLGAGLSAAPVHAVSGEAFAYAAWNRYAMTDLNRALTPLNAAPFLGPMAARVLDGPGAGLEANVRYGSAFQTGLGIGAEILFASARTWPRQLADAHGTIVMQHEELHLNALNATVRYSGGLGLRPWLSFTWGVAAGLGGLVSTTNYVVVDQYGMAQASRRFTTNRGTVGSVDVGPVFVLPGPRGVVLSARIGYRKFTMGSPIGVHDIYPTPIEQRPWDWSLDYSGVFFRIVLGSGTTGS